MSFKIDQKRQAMFWSNVHNEPFPSPKNLERRDSISSVDSDMEDRKDLIDRLKELVAWVLEQIGWVFSWFPFLDQLGEWLLDETPGIVVIEDQSDPKAEEI